MSNPNPDGIKRQLMASINSLIVNENQYQVTDAMAQIAATNLRRIHCDLVCDLLKTLLRKNIGTNDVENDVNKTLRYCTAPYKLSVKRKIMRQRLTDAYRKRNEAERQYWDTKSEHRQLIPLDTWNTFVSKCKRYVPRYRTAYMMKHKRKIDWLTNKYATTEVQPPDEIHGVKLTDQELGPEFESTHRQYGEVTTSNEEGSVLDLPPKFGLTRRVDVTKTVIEVEKCFNGMRWNHIISNQEERTENSAAVVTEFYDKEKAEMDINRMKPTDLPFNSKVCMPKALGLETEVIFQKLKNEIQDIATDMNKRTKDNSNLQESEIEGLKELKRRQEEKEIVCFQTDKSGRWAVDSIPNYKISTEKHLQDGVKEITLEEYETSEEQLNCHAKALLRMMGLKDDNNGERLRQTCTADGVNFAQLYSLRKDHKPMQEGEEAIGPKSRPVCGCEDCATKRVSYLLCQVLKPLVSESATHCDSTQKLLEGINEINNDEDLQLNESHVIGSLDIEALYPSLDIDKCASIVNEKLYKSKISFANLQWKEIMLYLRFMLTDRQLRDRGLYIHAQKRRKRRKRPPLFHASGSDTDTEMRRRPWVFTDCVLPNEDQTRKMWCVAVEMLVTKTMQNHCYMFEGRIYRQEEGGSIGLDLTGVVADIYMSWWDGQLIVLLREARIFAILYKRYVDDINMLLAMEIEGEIVGPKDKYVMEKVRQIANTIHPKTKATCDYGSNYPDGKLPMLDIKIWKGESTNTEQKILYEHYMKDVSSRHVINYHSAHPEDMKVNVLVNEALRILRNCSEHLPEEVKTNHLQYLVNRMQFSGYPQSYRHEVIARAFKKHSNNRNRVRREPRRMTDKRKWYNEEKYDGVMFVDVTPNGELKKRVEKVCKRNGARIKVVEKISSTVKRELQRSNPFGHEHCKRIDCVTCNLGLQINCRKRGLVYEMWCEDCKVEIEKPEQMYRGQTGRTTYHRVKEHFMKWEKKTDDSVLHKHSTKCHGGERFEVGIKLLATCYGKPTTRLISEAIHIEQIPEENSMNEKSEWNYVKLPRVGML